MLSLHSAVPHRVIFQNGDIILCHDFHKGFTAFHRPADACRVLEVGNDINKLDIFRRFAGFRGFGIMPLSMVGFDFERAFVRLESVDGSKVGRSLHEDHVAGVQENLAGHIEVRWELQPIACFPS